MAPGVPGPGRTGEFGRRVGGRWAPESSCGGRCGRDVKSVGGPDEERDSHGNGSQGGRQPSPGARSGWRPPAGHASGFRAHLVRGPCARHPAAVSEHACSPDARDLHGGCPLARTESVGILSCANTRDVVETVEHPRGVPCARIVCFGLPGHGICACLGVLSMTGVPGGLRSLLEHAPPSRFGSFTPRSRLHVASKLRLSVPSDTLPSRGCSGPRRVR